MIKSMRRLVLLALIAGVALSVEADAAPDNPTFYRNVLPLLQKHCQDCHRPGGDNVSGMIAPMSLVSYADVRPWAKSIKKAVAARAMPPWGGVPCSSASRNGSAPFSPRSRRQ